MNQTITAAERRYMAFVASLRCLICRRFTDLSTGLASEVHHLAEGSSRQNNWLVAPLCAEHHRGGAGLHGLGTKAFIALYKVPQGTEYGLLAWLQEDMQIALGTKKVA